MPTPSPRSSQAPGVILLLALVVLVLASSALARERARANLLAREHLLGDWEDLRSRLEEGGISLGLVYTFEVLSNIAGGVRKETESLGNVDVFADADLEKLLGWTERSSATPWNQEKASA